MSSPENGARVDALVEDLLRLVVAHTDSLDPLSAKVVASAACARLHVVQTIISTEQTDPATLLARLARFPWQGVVPHALNLVARAADREAHVQGLMRVIVRRHFDGEPD